MAESGLRWFQLVFVPMKTILLCYGNNVKESEADFLALVTQTREKQNQVKAHSLFQISRFKSDSKEYLKPLDKSSWIKKHPLELSSGRRFLQEDTFFRKTQVLNIFFEVQSFKCWLSSQTQRLAVKLEHESTGIPTSIFYIIQPFQ